MQLIGSSLANCVIESLLMKKGCSKMQTKRKIHLQPIVKGRYCLSFSDFECQYMCKCYSSMPLFANEDHIGIILVLMRVYHSETNLDMNEYFQ